jgi:hypothetical protein
VIKNIATVVLGAVRKNEKLVPPFIELSVAAPDPPMPYEPVKSLDNPTATPVASRTVIVHEISSLVCASVVDMLICPTHESSEAPLGFDTFIENGLPPDMVLPSVLTVM